MTTTTPTVPDLAKSYVRTVIPVVVGLIVSLALRAGLDLHGYTPEITSATTFLYYAAARALEHYADPRFGWLLGLASRPLYAEGVVKGTKHTRTARDPGAASGIVVLIIAVCLAALILGFAVNHFWLLLLVVLLLLLF